MNHAIYQTLDLRGQACPMNFVKAKIALEQIPNAVQVKILFDRGEAEQLLPQSLTTEGFQILEQVSNDEYACLLLQT